mmetsp:Transcript_7920/g.24309  ORF Transcript_7920/g.24309 Transcript_7920/m.24309 type:complete len:600 (+) Transcript_7920:1568-3367(+)
MEDVVAEANEARRLGRDVLVVARNHLDLNAAQLDLLDDPLGVVARGVEHRDDPGELHDPVPTPVLAPDRDAERLVPLERHGLVYLLDLGADLLGVDAGPHVAAVVARGEDFVEEALGDFDLALLRVRRVRHGPLDLWREADKLGHVVLLDPRIVVFREGVAVRAKHGDVDRVVVGVGIGGDGGPLQDLALVELGGRPDLVVKDLDLSRREGPGLVRAEHGHRGDLLHRGQVGHDGLLLGHLAGAERKRDLHDDGERDGDRGDEDGEAVREDVDRLLAAVELDEEDGDEEEDGDGHDELADLDDGALEDALGRLGRLLHEERGRAHLGEDARPLDEEVRVPRDDHAPREDALVSLAIGVLARERLAGERGRVDRHRVAVEPVDVGRDRVAAAQEDDVARHEGGRRELDKLPVPLHRRHRRERRLDALDLHQRLVLLVEPDARVDRQQHADDREILPLLHRRRQHHRDLDHHRHRRRQLLQQNRVPPHHLLRNLVRPVRLQPLRRRLRVQALHQSLHLLRRAARDLRLGIDRPLAANVANVVIHLRRGGLGLDERLFLGRFGLHLAPTFSESGALLAHLLDDDATKPRRTRTFRQLTEELW